MVWEKLKDKEYRMVELLKDGDKVLGRVAIKDGDLYWNSQYLGDRGVWHNLGVYNGFQMAKQIVVDRIESRQEESSG